MTAAIVFAVLSALSNACSAVLQRLAVVNHVSGARPAWRAAIDLVRQPMWLLGALFLVGTFGFQALALYFGPLSVVQPVLVLELIFTLGLRVFLLHDDIALRTWSAALTICLGLAAFLVVASHAQGTHDADAGQWILAVGIRGLVVLVLLLLARYGSPARRAALFGAATAIVWSVDAAFVKQAVDVLAHSGPLGLLTGWPLYAVIATGVLGTVLLQGAYAAGPLAASQATLIIVDPLASIMLGMELFHEQLSSSPWYVAGVVASLAALGTGVVMLSIWAPPVMTAEEPASLPAGRTAYSRSACSGTPQGVRKWKPSSSKPGAARPRRPSGTPGWPRRPRPAWTTAGNGYTRRSPGH